MNGHRETWPIRSRGFRRWLCHAFFEATNKAANSEAQQSALGVVEARAQFAAVERSVHVRVAGLEGKLYLDLCDPAWRAVEIDAAGWRMIDQRARSLSARRGNEAVARPRARRSDLRIAAVPQCCVRWRLRPDCGVAARLPSAIGGRIRFWPFPASRDRRSRPPARWCAR